MALSSSSTLYLNNRGERLCKECNSLGDTRMNDKHAAHCPTSIVKHPFPFISEISSKASLRMILNQLVDECGNEDGRVCRCGGVGGGSGRQGGKDGRVKFGRSEDVESGLQ